MASQLKRVIRLDSLPLDQTYFTEEGYLFDRPILTSTGIFEYTNDDGQIRRELRLPEDVFEPESLRSYMGKPIIITHRAGLVDNSNVGEFSIGTILTEGYRSGDDVRARIVIHDTRAMKNAGLKELSLGYNLDLEETPGEWNGQPYDAIQHNIRINHLALVQEARAGDQARLNIDSRDGKTFKGGRKMDKTQRNDGLTPEQLQQAIQEYLANHAADCGSATLDAEGENAEPIPTVPAEENQEEPVISADAEGEQQEPVEEGSPAEEAPAEQAPADTPAEPVDIGVEDIMPMTLEQQIGAVKERNPEPDEDMQILLNIIDRFLAEKAYDDANTPQEEPAQAPAAPEEEPKTDSRADSRRADSQDVASVADKVFCQRMKIARAAQKLNLDGVEYMPLAAAKRAVILADTPNIRLDGKSEVYLDALFDRVLAHLDRKGRTTTGEQARQMFNPGTAVHMDEDDNTSAAARFNAMLAKRRQHQ